MITDIFLTFLVYVFGFFFAIFPVGGGLSTEVTTAIQTFGSYTTIIDALVPLDTLGTIIGLVFAFELAVFAFKTLRWIWGHVPVIGGRG